MLSRAFGDRGWTFETDKIMNQPNPCAWCDRERGVVRPPATSHAICHNHARQMLAGLKKRRRTGWPLEIVVSFSTVLLFGIIYCLL